MSTENVQESNAPLRITISEVLSLLDQGKSRKEIAEHYGRTQTEMKRIVWEHPKLKNRKAKKQYTGIELEDDTEDAVATVAEVEVAQGQPEPVYQNAAPEQANAFNNAPAELVNGEMVGSADTSDWN
jgi:hypothetical protein